MPLLLLIRHGENDYTRTNCLAGRLPEVHLNDTGRQQAVDLAQALADLPIRAVYASPLERARETAAPLAAKHGLEVQIRPGLLETDIGEWAGQELKALRKLPAWKTVQNFPARFRFPGGESFIECQARLVDEIESLLVAHKPEDILVCVSHADPIKLIIAHYLGMPLDHFQRLGCDTASATALLLSENGVLLSRLNQRPPFRLALPAKFTRKPRPR